MLRSTPAPAPAAFDAGATFNTVCATCHGASGLGDGPAGQALDPRPASFVFKHLQSLILEKGAAVTLGARREAAGGSVCECTIGGEAAWLLLPGAGTMDVGESGIPRPVTVLDLVTGAIGPESDIAEGGLSGPALLLA